MLMFRGVVVEEREFELDMEEYRKARKEIKEYTPNKGGILLPDYELGDEKIVGSIPERKDILIPRGNQSSSIKIPKPPEVNTEAPVLVSTIDALQLITKTAIEACSTPDKKILPCDQHALFAASLEAFNEHRPLVLSPDILWLSILHGVAYHVQENSEEMRSKFVNFQEKKTIEVRRDDFIKGSPNNPWPEVFPEFAAQIQEYIGNDNYDRLIVPFTTTGPVEQASMDCALMDIVKNYFEYLFRTCCGTPSITFEGEPKDYETIIEKTDSIGKAYDMEWWTEHLTETLTLIHDFVGGKSDGEKLRHDWFNKGGASGGPYFNGHVIRFFPYLKNHNENYRNPYLNNNENCSFFRGISSDNVPQGLRSVPFTWEYFNNKIPMKFLTGFVGITYNEETHAVRPEIGWGISEENPKKLPEYWKVCKECGQEKYIEEMDVEYKSSRKNPTYKDTCLACSYKLKGW